MRVLKPMTTSNIITNCATGPTLQEPVKDPARLEWHEVTKAPHYYLSVNAMTRPMQAKGKIGEDRDGHENMQFFFII